jgi:quercetin dioxygenase-like cupin family protein
VDRQSAIIGRGNTILIAAGKDDTGGSFALLDYELAPGFASLALHIHGAEDEAVYVLEGRLLVRIADRERLVGPGEFVFLPKGIAHMHSNPTPDPVRFLVLLIPAGFEQCLHDLETLRETGGSFTPESIAPVLASYGVQAVSGSEAHRHASP